MFLKPTNLFKHFHSSLSSSSSPSLFFNSTLSLSRTNHYINTQITHFLSTQFTTLQNVLRLHSFIITTGNSHNVFISAKLISLYASLNRPLCSTLVFDQIKHKVDTFLWNSIIKAHFSNGLYSQSFGFYIQMRNSSALPNQFTIPMVVSTCAETMRLGYGMYAHGLALKCGNFDGNSAVGSSLIYMYSKCGEMMDAYKVFEEMLVRDVVAWTALLIGFVQNGESKNGLELFYRMVRLGLCDEKPNFRTIEAAIQACGDLGALVQGSCLHAFAMKDGLVCSENVRCSLLSMYSRCGVTDEACLCFDEIGDKDLLSWTSVIGVYARFGQMADCLSLFLRMLGDGVCPDGILISCLLVGFGNATSVSGGRAFHGMVIRRHYLLDRAVHNALISMYCKFGLLHVADKLFDRSCGLDKEPWNTMICGYSKVGMDETCLDLFGEMQGKGIETDSNSLVSVIASCLQLGKAHLGRSLHSHSIKISMDQDVSVANSLINFYCNNGDVTSAMKMFTATDKDIVTWNTLLSFYAHSDRPGDAITLFDEMIREDIEPNSATLVTILSACSSLALLEQGERIHQYIKQKGFNLNLSLASSLIDMYAKCGELNKSRELFNFIKEKDVVSWNVMISGYGMHGDAKSAIDVFQLMEKSNVRPNGPTFLSLLSACAHAGLVEEGEFLFSRMKHYTVEPELKHYACMVDLFGKSGYLQQAEELVLSMPMPPDSGIWGALLSACNMHDNIEIGWRIAKRAIESDPENDGYYILLSNMCSSIGRWDEVRMIRRMMKEKGVEKQAGWSIT